MAVKFKYILQVRISSADPETKAYVGGPLLRKEVTLCFVPPVGLKLGFRPKVTKKKQKRFEELHRLVCPTAGSLFEVQQVVCYPEQGEVIIHVKDHKELTPEGFLAIEEFLTVFFGFQSYTTGRRGISMMRAKMHLPLVGPPFVFHSTANDRALRKSNYDH